MKNLIQVLYKKDPILAKKVATVAGCKVIAKTEYVKLVKLLNKGAANKLVKELGWRNFKHFVEDTGKNPLGYYVEEDLDFIPVDSLPEDLKPSKVTPIFTIRNDKLFGETAKGYLSKDKKTAYVEVQDFKDLA